jgi:hypothetical protein
MKIYINYENKKVYVNTKNYESIKSIIYHFLLENNIKDDIDDFFLDYNGMHLDSNFSLEKYDIIENYILNLNKKNRGGDSFFNFAMKNPIQVTICLLIALLPIFILPLGFISSTACMIKVIIEKSISSIGKYLVCTLGKTTLFSRINLVIFMIKYVVFILMIYVIITLPLLILCITLKGHNVMDNPKNMCSPISAGSMAGMVLTMVFLGIYLCFRGGNYVINFLISLFKRVYILNTTCVPILKGLLLSYDEIKYTPVIAMTFGTIAPYFIFLRVLISGVEMVLTTISELGCKTAFTKEAFLAKITEKINNFNEEGKDKDKKENKDKNDTDQKFVNPFSSGHELCRDDLIKCCDPANYISIADTLLNVLNTGPISKMLKSNGLYPSFVLIIEAMYESALLRLNSSRQLTESNFNDKKIYLRKFLEEKRGKIPDDTKQLIKEFLNTGNEVLITDIQKNIDTLFKSDNSNSINDIKYKLALLEEGMIQFAIADKSKYVPGKSLFKTLFKFIFVDIFCNVASTAHTSEDVIREMGNISEITDMLKASTSTGLFMTIIYFITYIVLIICGIFNVF